MAQLVGARTVRLQVATFVVTGLLILILAVAVRDQLPRRQASSFAVVLLALLRMALMLAAFRVELPCNLSPRNPSATSRLINAQSSTEITHPICLGGLIFDRRHGLVFKRCRHPGRGARSWARGMLTPHRAAPLIGVVSYQPQSKISPCRGASRIAAEPALLAIRT
jgi:hypothetical protein